MHNRHRSLANEIRSYLSEFGITIPVGISPLRQAIPVLLEQNHSRLTTRFLVLPAEMGEELRQIDDRIDLHDKRIEQSAKEDDRIKRLLKIECIGPIVASEFVASVGDAQQFKGG